MPDAQQTDQPVLELRRPREGEEQELRRALVSLSGARSSLGQLSADMSLGAFVRSLEDQERGLGLPAGIVPATLLFGFVGGRIVGRISIRHTLNGTLARKGGHIGYIVIPEFRRRGYATAMLRLALGIARERIGLEQVLLTCDDDNIASIRTIERNGGVLERVVSDTDPGERPFRRYWLATSSAV